MTRNLERLNESKDVSRHLFYLIDLSTNLPTVLSNLIVDLAIDQPQFNRKQRFDRYLEQAIQCSKWNSCRIEQTDFVIKVINKALRNWDLRMFQDMPKSDLFTCARSYDIEYEQLEIYEIEYRESSFCVFRNKEIHKQCYYLISDYDLTADCSSCDGTTTSTVYLQVLRTKDAKSVRWWCTFLDSIIQVDESISPETIQEQ